MLFRPSAVSLGIASFILISCVRVGAKMRTDSFPSIIGVRNAKTKERNPDADLDEVIAKILDEPNRNSIGPGLLGWTKCAHEGRMRTYGRPVPLSS